MYHESIDISETLVTSYIGGTILISTFHIILVDSSISLFIKKIAKKDYDKENKVSNGIRL